MNFLDWLIVWNFFTIIIITYNSSAYVFFIVID